MLLALDTLIWLISCVIARMSQGQTGLEVKSSTYHFISALLIISDKGISTVFRDSTELSAVLLSLASLSCPHGIQGRQTIGNYRMWSE